MEDERHREVFRRLHGAHLRCVEDEWLERPCRARNGRVLDRPIVWSRRNGPWKRVDVVWVGAAPGNAGGRGAGALGAHGTRIPFGGDIAGANLEVLLGSIGLTRNETFIVAALNHLPDRGGGEPTVAEILSPEGGYPNSVAIVRDTILACGPRLIVALGNIGARVTISTINMPPESPRLPSLGALNRAGWERDGIIHTGEFMTVAAAFRAEWRRAWAGSTLPAVLWLLHPSAQNMSPFAGATTAFHRRMVEARTALRSAVAKTLGWTVPDQRAPEPDVGIYALPEWRERIAPRNAELDRLWREKGI